MKAINSYTIATNVYFIKHAIATKLTFNFKGKFGKNLLLPNEY
jgi:hypothetical protein